jgi:hypothetical protein
VRFVKSFYLFTLIFLLFCFLTPPSVNAGLVLIDKQGEIVWRVLSSQDYIALGIPKRETIEVKELAEKTTPSSDAKISLKRSGEKVFLNVESEGEEKELDVTNYEEELVEIEERGESQTVRIGVLDEKFSIEQRGVIALTHFPINIDSKSAELSVVTPSGARFLSMLPYGAVESVLRARVINKLTEDRKINLSEGDRGELLYTISGFRLIDVFDILSYPVDVTVKVSASTGEIVNIDQPLWLKVFGFIFI